MQHIGPYRLAARFSDYPALIGHQDESANQRNDSYSYPNTRRIQGLRGIQMLEAGQEQEQGRTGDKHALRQRRQRLGLAMAKGVLFISRLQ
ncbi:hypothetical protein D3C76_1348870 [compost metagenome]